jgi:hypothetical protein
MITLFDLANWPESVYWLARYTVLQVWFHHNLAGFSNSNNDFCCFLSVTTRYYDGPYTLLETG